MSLNSFFRISVLSAGIAVRRQQINHPGSLSSEAVRQLKAGPARVAYLDYDAAGAFAEEYGWEVFTPDEDRQKELQFTLLNMALARRPFWAKMSIFGRDRIKRIIDVDEFQCLELAGLFASPPPLDVVRWWDTLSVPARENTANNNLDIGRQGELLTLQYESNRLRENGLGNWTPLWKSIEDNTAGYDILSYDFDSDGQVRELYIEVKASKTIPCRFFLTRGEWETALDKTPAYVFHLWNLNDEHLLTYSTAQLEDHISIDRGQGQWVTIELPFGICG